MEEMNVQDYIQRVFSLGEKEEFSALALEAFGFQREHCRVYREYLDLIGKGDFHPSSIEEIPFLPIRLFKSRDIISSDAKPEVIFTSSATTGMTPSRHLIADTGVYEKSFMEGFRRVYGESGTYNLLALLPSYLERKGSSLVYMAECLIQDAKQNGAEGGFFLYDHNRLLENLKRFSSNQETEEENQLSGDLNKKERRKTILLGVSFALLDFAEYVKRQVPEPDERAALFSDVIVIETGGMKGRGEELSREELHRRLREGFCGARIDSEYGMCELLSQAYSIGDESEGVFFTPPWMRVLARDLMDPFKVFSTPNANGKNTICVEGGLNIIDLANIHSCCFIETEDQGRIIPATDKKKSVHPAFTVDGRIQNSELRGCNMLIAE